MRGRPKVIATKSIYSGWFKVREDSLEMPGLSHLYPYGIIKVDNGVAVLPFLDRKNLVLAKQYRHPRGDDFLELIQGGIKPGESKVDAAFRELREETGYEAGKLEHLTSICLMPGSLDHVLDFYVATNLRSIGKQSLEPAEHLEVVIRPYKNVLDEVIANKHTDGALNIGILRYELLSRRNILDRLVQFMYSF